MVSAKRVCLGIAGLLLPLTGIAAQHTAAASMGHAYALHGSGQFAKAMASATVTQVSKGDVTIAVTAEHLPSPAMLHVKPARHAYVAWFVNGSMTHSMGMASIALMYDKKTGNYSAHGTLMIDKVTAVVITAEPSAMTHMPVTPQITVLTSMSHTAM